MEQELDRALRHQLATLEARGRGHIVAAGRRRALRTAWPWGTAAAAILAALGLVLHIDAAVTLGLLSVVPVAIVGMVLVAQSRRWQAGRGAALALIDERFALKDRARIADAFVGQPARGGFADAALQEAQPWLTRSAALPLALSPVRLARWGWGALALAALLTVLSILSGHGKAPVAHRDGVRERSTGVAAVIARLFAVRDTPSDADRAGMAAGGGAAGPAPSPGGASSASGTAGPVGDRRSGAASASGERSTGTAGGDAPAGRGGAAGAGRNGRPAASSPGGLDAAGSAIAERASAGDAQGAGQGDAPATHAAAASSSSAQAAASPHGAAPTSQGATQTSSTAASNTPRKPRDGQSSGQTGGQGASRPGGQGGGRAAGQDALKRSHGGSVLLLAVPMDDRVIGATSAGQVDSVTRPSPPGVENAAMVAAQARGTRRGDAGRIGHGAVMPQEQRALGTLYRRGATVPGER